MTMNMNRVLILFSVILTSHLVDTLNLSIYIHPKLSHENKFISGYSCFWSFPASEEEFQAGRLQLQFNFVSHISGASSKQDFFILNLRQLSESGLGFRFFSLKRQSKMIHVRESEPKALLTQCCCRCVEDMLIYQVSGFLKFQVGCSRALGGTCIGLTQSLRSTEKL